MGSREKDPTTPHQPLLSSLVIRPTDTVRGATAAAGGGFGGSDYEPGEVRRDPPPYSRSDRYGGHGYRMRAGSFSPRHRRNAHRRSSPGFETFGGASRGRGFRSEREPGRHRDFSPPYVSGKDLDRFCVFGYDQSSRGLGPLRDEGLPRNNPNIRPREGDWICSDPLCKNLNFARREHCNNCNRPRYASSGSPRGGYLGRPISPRQRFPPILLDQSPVRNISVGYRSPPRGWPREASRDFRVSGPPGSNEVRFLDPLMRGERLNFPEDPMDNRFGYDRSLLPEWAHRDHQRDNYFNERRGGYGGRFLSPPPASTVPRGWAPRIRDRSRSPVRGKNYQREHMNRRRGIGRGALYP